MHMTYAEIGEAYARLDEAFALCHAAEREVAALRAAGRRVLGSIANRRHQTAIAALSAAAPAADRAFRALRSIERGEYWG